MSDEKIPVLYVHQRSHYKKVPGFDCYDENRDSLTFSGSVPVIAHPPCRLWSQLRSFSTADEFEKVYAWHALNLVRKNGGILEHPLGSSFWKSAQIVEVGSVDSFGGFCLVINQFDFGFYTKKATKLYIVGIKPSEVPRLPLRFEYPVRKFANLSSKQRSETTPQLIEWFREIIELIKLNK